MDNILYKRPVPHQKYFFNENYFDLIDTEDKAYFLGLLMADGYNSGEGFLLALNSEDKEILKTFSTYLDYSGELKHRPKKDVHTLNIYSKHMSETLSSLGVIKNKAHFTKMPTLPNHLYRHFIRGVFDGDGCIYYSKYLRMNITGNFDLINSIQNFIHINLGIENSKLQKCNSNNNTTKMQYASKKAFKILEWLYNDSTLYLERKHNKFLKYKKDKYEFI